MNLRFSLIFPNHAVREPGGACDDGGFSGRKRVALALPEDKRFLRLFKNQGVDRVRGGLEKLMRGEDGADLVEFLDGKSVGNQIQIQKMNTNPDPENRSATDRVAPLKSLETG
ncbi:hypothetical protein U1Q18_027459 [Sarracenia purpurea var. burkii]